MSPSTAPAREAPLRHRPRLRRPMLRGYRYVRRRWRVLFAAIDALGTTAAFLLHLLLPRLGCRTGQGEPRRILVLQLDHLGDAVITTAIFGPLKTRFPQASIHVLAAPWNRAVFDIVPEVERVDVCGCNRFAPGCGLAWIAATVIWGLRMRKRRYDLAIDVRGEFPHNVILWLTGAPRRLGWACGGGGFLLTHRPAWVADRPEVDSRAALLQCLAIGDCGTLQPAVSPTQAAAERAQSAWNELGTADGRARIALHVGAGTPAKRWPAEHWRALVNHLAHDSRAAVVLLGTAGDRSTAEAILGSSPQAQAADWTGRFSVDELAAVLQLADLVVGADSGPAHLAAAVGTPVVALFSGTNSAQQWQPRGEKVVALQSEVSCRPCHRKTCPIPQHPCMRGIRPGAVIAALERLLPEPSRHCET